MKKFILIIFLTLLLFPAFSAPNKPQYVSVSNAVVRAKASQFSTSVGTLEYGEAVTIEKVENGWSNITSSDGKITGWLPNSSLTAKKLAIYFLFVLYSQNVHMLFVTNVDMQRKKPNGNASCILIGQKQIHERNMTL